ncbi:mitotic spindle assembly checkpoint protein MAD1-like [Drosophila elegans]|uniref:mitotic spindle assembly checkpoint protein MAD1-like n=1 Tax=Drosophila elegans TaxID=30023 RepID=UPI0007E8B20B|nr:mitotic spindle assembly checkpoint protein MAD1-like [Drosophila elegans]
MDETPNSKYVNNLSTSAGNGHVASSKKRRLEWESPAGSQNATGSSAESVPPERSSLSITKLRVELIESKALVIKLRGEIDQMIREHQEALMLAENKSSVLKAQCDSTGKRYVELQEEYQTLRARELAQKSEARLATAALAELKLKNDAAQDNWEKEQCALKADHHDAQMRTNNEMNKFRRMAHRCAMELKATRHDAEFVRQWNTQLREQVSEHVALRNNFELQQQSLQMANERIKALEYEIQSYKDWKEITEVAQQTLLSVPDLRAEVERLRKTNKNLHTLIGDKLLLEEQVNDYKERLERDENVRAEAASLQVKLKHAEQELVEWTQLAQDHCLQNTLATPMALRERIETMLQHNLIYVADKCTAESDRKHMQGIVRDLEVKCALYLKNLEELNIELKRHSNFEEQLQRKLMIVSKERDVSKLLMKNFEKDMTLGYISVMDSTKDIKVQIRVHNLERTVDGYKEMLDLRDSQIAELRKQAVPQTPPSSAGYDCYRKQMDSLRLENDQLRRRKEDLELRNEKLMDDLKKLNTEKDDMQAAHNAYRNVCCWILGYKIDCIGGRSSYRISSRFAERLDEHLDITLYGSRRLSVLDSPYSQAVCPPNNQYLPNNDFPEFFANLTLKLFRKPTTD